ncbi:MAG: asparagine synthase, partial [Candidatus Brocadiaceae bacterium]|nr:asparagine synthase [Candidatus Brocadiaceae bacterium]
MSAIFGVFNFSGKPVEPGVIKRMEAHLTPWGPDGQSTWINQSIALGFNAMRITPEDSYEAQPLASPSGRYKVVADMRLDVREEIHQSLNLRVDKATTPDSYYFAAAFDNWGEETWTKISGGYTAAVWDLQAGTLYLVRDALGERPLFYTSERSFFAFSTATKGLFAHPEISRELDERKIADLLLVNSQDKGRTVYSKINRLPPGHALQITGNGQITLKRYYSLYDVVTSQPPIKLKQEEYVAVMREKLEKAVKRRIRSSYALGAHLSSGLDSSTVSCIAANQLAKSGRRLTSFTMSPYTEEDVYVPKGRYYDESPLAKLIAENNGNIDYQQLPYEDVPLFSGWEKDYAFQQAPILGHYNHVWYSKLMEEASKHDIRVLLAGFAGNLTFSYNGRINLPEVLRYFWYKFRYPDLGEIILIPNRIPSANSYPEKWFPCCL